MEYCVCGPVTKSQLNTIKFKRYDFQNTEIQKVVYLLNFIADMKHIWDYINNRIMKQIPNDCFWVKLGET
jgi:hypothetical protein